MWFRGGFGRLSFGALCGGRKEEKSDLIVYWCSEEDGGRGEKVSDGESE